QLLVERARGAERVAAAHAHRRRQTPNDVDVHTPPREIERGTHALLDAPGDNQVVGPKPARLPIRADDPVLREAKALDDLLRILRWVSWTQADACVEVDGAIRAKEVPPADVEKAAWRELD